jgi:hypothetical protein
MKRWEKTLELIDIDTNPLIDRINQDGYVMNEHDNQELRMRIEAIKTIQIGYQNQVTPITLNWLRWVSS